MLEFPVWGSSDLIIGKAGDTNAARTRANAANGRTAGQSVRACWPPTKPQRRTSLFEPRKLTCGHRTSDSIRAGPMKRPCHGIEFPNRCVTRRSTSIPGLKRNRRASRTATDDSLRVGATKRPKGAAQNVLEVVWFDVTSLTRRLLPAPLRLCQYWRAIHQCSGLGCLVIKMIRQG